jgi:hypothetical protein
MEYSTLTIPIDKIIFQLIMYKNYTLIYCIYCNYDLHKTSSFYIQNTTHES